MYVISGSTTVAPGLTRDNTVRLMAWFAPAANRTHVWSRPKLEASAFVACSWTSDSEADSADRVSAARTGIHVCVLTSLKSSLIFVATRSNSFFSAYCQGCNVRLLPPSQSAKRRRASVWITSALYHTLKVKACMSSRCSGSPMITAGGRQFENS
jgi:hypothetical protein